MDKNVDHPSHYTFGKYEVIDVIEDWNLGYYESNIVKYLARAKHKGKELEDLKKARWYLDRLIGRMSPAKERTDGTASAISSSMWNGLLTGSSKLERTGTALPPSGDNKSTTGCCGVSHNGRDS